MQHDHSQQHQAHHRAHSNHAHHIGDSCIGAATPTCLGKYNDALPIEKARR